MDVLNVVGLLSGGKDSCYNLCHCAALGHRIVALATLAPPQGKGWWRKLDVVQTLCTDPGSASVQMSWTRTCTRPWAMTLSI